MTVSDVVQFGDVKVPFSFCSIGEVFQIEYREARTCIGMDLYDAMVAAKADYSDVEEYVAGTYLAGEVVLFEGKYYEALTETIREPTVVSDWKVADHFTGPCAEAYEVFYCRFLAPYLAKVVLSEKLPYIVTQISDGGITYRGRKYNQEDAAGIKRLEWAIVRDQENAWANASYYLAKREERFEEGDCFEGWKPTVEKKENECGKCGGNDCSECRIERRSVGGYEFG